MVSWQADVKGGNPILPAGEVCSQKFLHTVTGSPLQQALTSDPCATHATWREVISLCRMPVCKTYPLTQGFLAWPPPRVQLPRCAFFPRYPGRCVIYTILKRDLGTKGLRATVLSSDQPTPSIFIKRLISTSDFRFLPERKLSPNRGNLVTRSGCAPHYQSEAQAVSVLSLS